MDGRTYGRSYFSLSTESLSGQSAIDLDTLAEPPSGPGRFLPQAPRSFLKDEEPQINGFLRDVPPNTHNFQAEEEVTFIVSRSTRSLYQPTDTDLQPYRSGLLPSMRSTLIRSIDERVGIPHPENLIDGIHEANLPATFLSDPTGIAWTRTTDFPSFNQV